MKQISRKDYIIRHLKNFLPYLTVYKVINLIINAFEKRFKIASPISLPPYLKIEPTPLCQLRCPGCEQSTENYKKQFSKDMQISLDEYKRIVDPLSRGLLGISLSVVGEPLLYKNISSLIEYAHNKKIAVSFPTNLSLKLDEASIDKLVKSRLDSLLVSLDGASEESYSKYRVGGNFELVLRNVRAIADAKQKYGFKRPKITWKFVIFDHNKHELDIVRKRHKEYGFDDFEFVPDAYSDESKENAQRYNEDMRKSGKGCYWLWHAMIIRWDGEIYPCCRISEPFHLGNAIQDNVREIWRSKKYRALRKGFSGKGHQPDMNYICRYCLGYDSGSSEGAENQTGCSI